MKKISLLLLATIAFCGFCVFLFQPSKAQSSQEPVVLFDLVGTEKIVAMDRTSRSASRAGVREHEIKVNFDKDFEGADQLNFLLLDGMLHTAVRRETEGFTRFGRDEFSWRGKISGENNWSGDVILTIKDRVISGLIYAPDGVYEIIPQENSRHLLVQIDQSQFPACAGAIPARPESESVEDRIESGVLAEDAFDDGSQIDVMVLYTANVRSALGGTTQAQTFAQQSIASANTAYQNSGINPRLRLVNTMEVNYAEAGTLSAALTWVANDATVAAARNSSKADLVAILIENASDGCGVAYVMRNVGSAFENSGFSATDRSCAVGNLSFAHELGHNQGSEHNPENGAAPSQASYPYAFGHYVNGRFRTVMSYADPCSSGCNRVPYFSNPSVSLNGFATGIADQRDNRRVLNNTAYTISQFRISGSTGGTLAQMTSPSNGSTFTSKTVNFNWTLGTGNSQYYLYVGNSPGSSEYFYNYISGGSTTVGGLPADNRTIYVRLWSLASSGWLYNDYTYKACNGCGGQLAQMTSPTNGSTFTSRTVTFNWSLGSGNSQYYLYVGNSPGSSEYFYNYISGGSTTVGGLPADNRTIYVRLWSLASSGWLYNDYTYKACSGCGSQVAQMTSPASGSAFISTTVSFNWTLGSGNSQYYLYVGNSLGSSEYFYNYISGGSTTVGGLPGDGRNIYVRLWSLGPAGWTYLDYSYRSCACFGNQLPQITNPINTSKFGSSVVTFTWNAGTGGSQYFLYVGNSVGSSEYFYNYISGGSTTVGGLPSDGRTIYVRIWSLMPSGWTFNNYVYKAAG